LNSQTVRPKNETAGVHFASRHRQRCSEFKVKVQRFGILD
jgi:hypothetical protein